MAVRSFKNERPERTAKNVMCALKVVKPCHLQVNPTSCSCAEVNIYLHCRWVACIMINDLPGIAQRMYMDSFEALDGKKLFSKDSIRCPQVTRSKVRSQSFIYAAVNCPYPTIAVFPQKRFLPDRQQMLQASRRQRTPGKLPVLTPAKWHPSSYGFFTCVCHQIVSVTSMGLYLNMYCHLSVIGTSSASSVLVC